MTTTQTKRVRVTVEGDATEYGCGRLLAVTTDDGARLYLPPSGAGVTLEDITPAWQWTDGDVVQYDAGDSIDYPGPTWTLTRRNGEWTNDNGVHWPDGSVTLLVTGEAEDHGHARRELVRVLRHQAGEVPA